MVESHSRPEPGEPALVAAFRGWNDAAEAASLAVLHLVRAWSATSVASIEPDDFFDFHAVRPFVEIQDGVIGEPAWPANEFLAGRPEGSTSDVLLLLGTEPNLRWGAFTRLVAETAAAQGVRRAITLSSMFAHVPHSRPVRVTAAAREASALAGLDLPRAGYRGPTGLITVLHDALHAAGIPSVSLYATVPRYLPIRPNPKTALALLQQVAAMSGAGVDLTDLERATASYERQVDEVLAGNANVRAYVRMLEGQSDQEAAGTPGPPEIPSADDLAAEVERFLREQEGPGQD